MKQSYKLFVPDGPSSTALHAVQRWRVVAELSVRFPRAMAQGRKLATHYGPACIVAHAGADGQPAPLRHACYVTLRSVEEMNRIALRKAVHT